MRCIGRPVVGPGCSRAGCWPSGRSGSAASRSLPLLLNSWACLWADRFQVCHPRQNERCHAEDEHPAHPLCTPMAGLPQPSHGLQPPKHLLDQLASPLADLVAPVAGGPPVNRTPAIRVVLSHVRGDPHVPQRRNEVPCVVALIRSHTHPAATLVPHPSKYLFGRPPLRRSRPPASAERRPPVRCGSPSEHAPGN
jgi:hypothetical protein